MIKPFNKSFSELVLVLLITLLFISNAAATINKVGYYYDEYLHAVSTQKLISGNKYKSDVPQTLRLTFLQRSFPIMILYYVGPLKTYALIPTLWLNNSVTMLRISTILMAALNLILTYILVQKLFSRRVALVAIILLTFDPSYVLSAALDWGPIAIQQLLKTILLIVTFKITTQPEVSLRKLIIVGFLSSLLIWDKLNSVWILIPIWIVIFNHLRTNNKVKQSLPPLTFGILIAGLPMLLFVIKRPFFYSVSNQSFHDFENYFIHHSDNINVRTLLINYSSKFFDKINTMSSTLNGVSIPNHILIKPIIGGYFAGIFIFTLLALFYLYLVHRDEYRSKIGTLLFISISVILFTFLTPNANGIHHMLILWPLPHILVAYAITRINKHNPIITILLIAILLLPQISILNSFYGQLSDKNMKVYWRRESMVKLVSKLSPQKHYISLDWGITLPVAFLSKGRYDIKDLQPFYKPKCEQVIDKTNTVYILHESNQEVFTAFRKECKIQLQKLNIENDSGFTLYSSNI